MKLTIRIPLPSPLVGGKARPGGGLETSEVMGAIEELRAETALATISAMMAQRHKVHIQWHAPDGYVIPPTAERYVRQGLFEGGATNGDHPLVTQSITDTPATDDECLIITVEEVEA
jgi:hypothetical protein